MGICNRGGGGGSRPIHSFETLVTWSQPPRSHPPNFQGPSCTSTLRCFLTGCPTARMVGPLKTHLTRGQRWRTWGWCGRSAACSPARPASPPPRHSSAGETDQQSDETNDSNKNLESVESNGPDEPNVYEKIEDLTYRVIFLTGHP